MKDEEEQLASAAGALLRRPRCMHGVGMEELRRLGGLGLAGNGLGLGLAWTNPKWSIYVNDNYAFKSHKEEYFHPNPSQRL